MTMNVRSALARVRAVAVGAALVAVIGISTVVVADLGEGGGPPDPAPPGTPEVSPSRQELTESFGLPETITTTGGTFDPTILTKFIGGRGFEVNSGTPGGIEDDSVLFDGQTCVRADAAGLGAIAVVFAAVELPDGARIKQVAFYGTDTYAPADISIQLYRGNVNVLLGVNTRAETLVDSFSTLGVNGEAAVLGTDNLGELAGTSTSILTGTDHRFHIVRVQMTNAAAGAHVLCGVEVRYQVPATTETGTVFHPIVPVRAYDSRIAAYPVNGPIANNTSRVVDISAGHDLATGAVTLANAVPAGATAITFNLTSAESTTVGFVAVTPGDAATFATSSLNLNGTPLANGGTVSIAGDRTIKVFVGGGGSTQVIVDVTGYYSPPVPAPNMGN